MEPLFQIVYTSTAVNSLSRKDLLELLKGSVQRNTLAGITGLLLYHGGTFMQALEGREQALITLFGKIRKDPRHHHVIPLIHEQIKERHFPNSAMAFRDLESELRNLPGYSDFLNTPMDGELLKADIPRCRRLLLHFKQNIR